MNADEKFEFAKENDAGIVFENPWIVYIVDDDKTVLQTTQRALESFIYKDRKIKMSFFSSGTEVIEELSKDNPLDPEVAVIFLDIVMEDSGFDVIHFLRYNKENDITQIVLRTGQAGKAIKTENEIALKYEINDFIDKSESSYKRIHTALSTSLRMFELLKTLSKVQRNLDIFNSSLMEFFNLKKGNSLISKEDNELIIGCIFDHLNNSWYSGEKRLDNSTLKRLIEFAPYSLQMLFVIISNALKKSKTKSVLLEDLSPFGDSKLYWEKDESILKSLYEFLCKKNIGSIVNSVKFIASDTPWEIFRDHHTRLTPASPIMWLGNLSDLLYLYFALDNVGFISKGAWGASIHTELALHYCSKTGMLKPDVLKTIKTNNSEKTDITSSDGTTIRTQKWIWDNPNIILIDNFINELLK